MGRKKTSNVGVHFDYDFLLNKSKCKHCDKYISGKVVTNLKKHLEKVHNELVPSVIVVEKPKTVEPGVKRLSTSSCSMDLFVQRKRKCVVEMDVEEIEDACIELVTKNGRPFAIVEDSGFKKLTQHLFRAHNYSMYSKKLSTLTIDRASKEKEQFKQLLQGVVISLKMDIATRLNRSFIGINVQFYKEGRFHLYTLAVKELHKSHTAETILEYLENTIKEYGIHKEQVHSATVDNGSNFLCALRVCSEISDEVEDEADEETESDEGDTEDAVVMQEQDEFDKFTIPWLKTMRCAAHTLQLAVWDFVKARNIQVIIVRARWLVRKLRTPTLRYMLKARELPVPLIDVVTRWSSTAVMLENLVILENTVKELVEKKFIESKGVHITFWNSLKDLSSLLEPARIATTKLQTSNLTAGEFHEIWTKMKLNIQNQGTVSSGIFVKCVEEREKKIFSNEALVMSIYADPRYKSILSPEQVRLGREKVLALADRLLKLSTAQTVQPTRVDINVQIDDDEDCAYENILAGGEQKNTEFCTTLAQFREEILKFENSARVMDRKMDIFKWVQQQTGYSEFFRMVMGSLLAFPVTQVSVERVFSALKFILNDLRGKLASQTIDDIMFLRLNCFLN